MEDFIMSAGGQGGSMGGRRATAEKDVDDVAYWERVSKKLRDLNFLSPLQHDFIMAALRGFGGGWTQDVLDRAFRATNRLRLHEPKRQQDVMRYFVTQAQTAFPALKDKVDMVVRVTRVMVAKDIVDLLETQVYIFYAARDNPELLNHI